MPFILFNGKISIQLFFGVVEGIGGNVVVGIRTARAVTHLHVPVEVEILPLGCPETVRAQREARYLQSLLTLLLHGVQIFSPLPLPLLRILHVSPD